MPSGNRILVAFQTLLEAQKKGDNISLKTGRLKNHQSSSFRKKIHLHNRHMLSRTDYGRMMAKSLTLCIPISQPEPNWKIMDQGHTMTKCVLKVPQIPHNSFGPFAQISQLFGIFLKKSSYLMSIVDVIKVCNSRFLLYYIYWHAGCSVKKQGSPGNLPGLPITTI